MNEFPGIDGVKSELLHGSISRCDRWEGFNAGFLDKSGVRLDPYNWSVRQYALAYVLRGHGILTDDLEKKHPVSEGDFYQRLPGRRHQLEIDPESGWKECCLSVGEDMSAPLVEMRLIKREPLVRRVGVDKDIILKVWDFKERLKAAGETELPLMLLEILGLIAKFHLFHEALPEAAADTALINEACDHLGKNFRENRGPMEFCKAKGVGYERFRKMFQKRVGVPPGQYRVRKRLDTARQMLSGRTMSIGEIAWELGFSSQFEFSSQFKKHMGCPPSGYFK